MAKKYTFKVTATLCEEDEDLTREEALEEIKEFLELFVYCPGEPFFSPFDKIEIV